jgi:Holliday junction resolvasome RuvABC endonuclease subunit
MRTESRLSWEFSGYNKRVIILALDPATVTGWALYDGASVSEANFKEFTKTSIDGERLLEAHRWLKSMIYDWKPDLIVAEGFYASSRFSNGSNVNHELRGVFKMTAAEANVNYIVVGPSEWKKALCGRTTPTKAEKKLYGKEKAKKMVTVEALTALGLHIPEKVVNAKTGKLINFKFDVSDALGILCSHLKQLGLPTVFSEDIFPKE